MTDRRERGELDGRASGALSRRLHALAPDREVAAPAQEIAPLTRPRRRARQRPSSRGNAEFHPAALAIDEAPRAPIRALVVGSICALLAAALAWSVFGRVPLYTSAAGKVQTTGRTKVVEALEIGKVAEIRARDGQTVKAGDALVQLDATDAQAARDIVFEKLSDLRAETDRERMEIVAARAATIDPTTKISWSGRIPAAARSREDAVARADLERLAAELGTLTARKHVKEAERDKFAKNIEAQKALVAITQENLTMIESLMKSGFNSQAKYLDMKALLDGQQVQQTSYEGSLDAAKQAIFLIDSEIAKTRETFVTTRTQAISSNEQAIVDFAQQLVRADQRLANMTVRAPVAGLVHASAVTTLGQVVKPGQQLMQIVPSDTPLEIEAYIQNSDIGFIRAGDPAIIKVDAFAYNVYGSIDATVTDVGRDALALQGKATVQEGSLDGSYRSLSAAQKTGNLQYPIHLKAVRPSILVEGKLIPLVPGMGVTVEIETERLRAIDYVLTPIEVLLSTAGHER